MNSGYMQDVLKPFIYSVLFLPLALHGQQEPCTPPDPAIQEAILAHKTLSDCARVSACMDTLGKDTFPTENGIKIVTKTRVRVVCAPTSTNWSAQDSLLQGPVRISGKKCPVFKLTPKALAKKNKDRCSCFHFQLAGKGKATRNKDGHFSLITPGKAGDTLVLEVEPVDQKPLKAVVLLNSKRQILQADFDAGPVRYSTVLTGEADTFQLYLRARGFLAKRYAFVRASLHHQPDTTWWSPGQISAGPMQAAAAVETREIAFHRKKTLVSTGDTLLYQVTDFTLSLTGKRNPMGAGAGVVEVNIPEHVEKNDRLLFLTWWVGTGAPTIAAYAALEADTPPEWSQPGVTAPLAAYGLGKPVVLPAMNRVDPGLDPARTPFVFAGENGKNSFLKSGDPGKIRQLFGRSGISGNYGRIEPGGLRRFYIAFVNQHDANTYPVQVKIVAYYERRVEKEQMTEQP